MKIITNRDPHSDECMAEAQARVEHGMKVLDAIEPDWRERMNAETLQLSSSSSCVWGQLSGNYESGIRERLGLDFADADDRAWCASKGFITGISEPHSFYEALDCAWKAALNPPTPMQTVTEVWTHTFEIPEGDWSGSTSGGASTYHSVAKLLRDNARVDTEHAVKLQVLVNGEADGSEMGL